MCCIYDSGRLGQCPVPCRCCRLGAAAARGACHGSVQAPQGANSTCTASVGALLNTDSLLACVCVGVCFVPFQNFKSMVLGLSGHAIIERAVAFPDGEDALQKIYDDPVGLERIRAFSLSGSVNSWDGNGADWGAGPPTSAASSIASLATWRGRASFTGASPTSRGSAASPRHRRTSSNTSVGVGAGGGAGGGAGVGARTPPMSPGSARRRAWDAVATATATNTTTTAKPPQSYETPTRDRRQAASRASPASPPPVSTHLPTRVHKPGKASEHTWRSLGRRTAHHRPLVPYKVNTAHVSVQYPVQCKDYMVWRSVCRYRAHRPRLNNGTCTTNTGIRSEGARRGIYLGDSPTVLAVLRAASTGDRL